VAYGRVQIVKFGVRGCLAERFRRLGRSVLWMDHIRGAVCKTVGFSKGHSEDPDVAPLPNLAVYENQERRALLGRPARRTPGHPPTEQQIPIGSLGEQAGSALRRPQSPTAVPIVQLAVAKSMTDPAVTARSLPEPVYPQPGPVCLWMTAVSFDYEILQKFFFHTAGVWQNRRQRGRRHRQQPLHTVLSPAYAQLSQRVGTLCPHPCPVRDLAAQRRTLQTVAIG